MRKAAAVAVVILAALVTAGCSATGIDAFDREQADGDRLPTSVIDATKVAADTTRFLATDEGVSFFVAKSADSDICLVAYPEQPEADPYAACSPGGHIGLDRSGGGDLELIPYANQQREGWRLIAPNLYVEE